MRYCANPTCHNTCEDWQRYCDDCQELRDEEFNERCEDEGDYGD